MRSRSVTLIFLLVGLTACGWNQPDFDAGRSNSNPFENTLTVENVGSLQHHVIPTTGTFPPRVLTVGDLVLVSGAGGVDAFPSTACPRADNGPCTARWHRDGQLLTADGSSIYLRTSATTFDSFGLDGVLNHHYDTTPAAGFGLSRLASTGTYLVAELFKSGGTPTSRGTAYASVFSANCTANPCAPERSIPLATKYGSYFNWAAKGSVLYSADPSNFDHLTAWDLGAGTALWSAVAVPNDIRVSNGLLYSTGGVVFDANGVNGCSGTPLICTPLRNLDGAYEPDSISGTRVMDVYALPGNPSPPSELRFWRTDAVGCTPSPVSCPSVARSAPMTFASVISTSRLAFTVASVSSIGTANYLRAFDITGAAGCTGTPLVCAPLLDFNFANNLTFGNLVVAGGRVYAPTSDGAIHVFSLPGAIS